MKKNMKKAVFPVVLAMLLVLGLGGTVFAAADGTVTFDGSKVAVSYDGAGLAEAFSGMSPGDEVTFTFRLVNSSGKTSEWYVENQVKKAFEDSAAASNGAFSYEIAYQDPAGTATVLYTNDTVGGETAGSAPQGLHQATSAMEEYFYLGSLAPGEQAAFTIRMAIDGETLSNSYQNTLADLAVNFGVETPDGTSATTKPRTGDLSDVTLYLALFAVTAVILAVLLLTRARKEGSHAE